jgi:branched-subunit amino acid ABC-type transport system permease component
MVDVADLFQSVLLGSLYALMALGLTLTYAVSKVPNFAHAEYVTVGGYTAALVTLAYGGAITFGEPGGAAVIVAAFALALLVAAAIAMLSDELVFKPLFRRTASPLHLLVASIGVGLVIRYALSLLVAPYDLLVVSPRIGKDLIRLPGGEPLAFAGAPITNLLAGVIPTTFGIVVALHLLFTRTRIGKGMRAMASNFDLARVAGIKTTNVRRIAWLVSGGLTGLGGAFWVVDVPGTPEMGWGILLWLFAASILGGFTSFWGTIAGGFIVGFAENMGISALHEAFDVSLSYRPLIALVIIVVVFLFRPQGITGLTTGDFVAAIRKRFARVIASLGRA